MKKIDIKEKDGYMTINDLPHNCIFNKVRTGCGGTTIALGNEENYVIAVPTTELIVNKLNSNENLFGFYGNYTPILKKNLISYTGKKGVKKIMCTYDKLPLLVELINTMEYRLLVDEYHNLLKQYSFRSNAINGVLDNFRKFKSFCFMSATIIDVEFKPEVLNDVPEYVADWNEEQNLYITPIKTNKPYQLVKNFIDHYLLQGYIIVGEHKSYEAFFFINSVKSIASIIKKCGLTNDNCRVICANDDKGENKKKLGDIEISNSLSPNKMFTFITSKSFEGADFFSETGLCFVISETNVKHTITSIDLDIPQIAGRIRNKENPFKNKVIHIFNTKADDSYISYEEYREAQLKELEIAKERVSMFNQLSPEAQKQQAKETKNSTYIRYVNGKFEVNDRMIKYKLFEYKLIHQIYSSGDGIEQAYEKEGFSSKKIKWHHIKNEEINRYSKSESFLETFKRYDALQYSFDNARALIEQKYPFITEAKRILGSKEICRLRTITAVKEALRVAKLVNKPNHNEMFKLLKPEIQIGKFYLKLELDEICEKFGLKIKDLKEWYNIKSTTKWIDKKSQYGYIIMSEKA